MAVPSFASSGMKGIMTVSIVMRFESQRPACARVFDTRGIPDEHHKEGSSSTSGK